MTRQTFDFPFIGGVDESRDPRVTTAPMVVQAENFRVKDGATGMWSKRRGTAELGAVSPSSPSPTPVGPVRLFSHDNQLCVCDETSAWTYSPAEDQLEELEVLPQVTLTKRRPLGHYGAYDVVARGVASVTDFTVYAWMAFDGTTHYLHVQTLDNQTGSGSGATRVPITGTSAGANHLKVIGVNDSKVVVLWGETPAGPSYVIRYMDVTSANAGPYTSAQGSVLETGVDQTDPQWFDAVPHGTGYLIAYYNGTTVSIKRYNSSHASQASTTASFTGAEPRIQVCGDLTGSGTATCALCIFSTTNAFVRRLTDALATVGTVDEAYSSGAPWETTGVSAVAASTFIASDATGYTAVVYNAVTSGGYNYCKVIYYGPSDAREYQGVDCADTYVMGKPFGYRNDLYFPAMFYTSAANSHACVMRQYDPQIVSSRTLYYMMPEVRFAPGRGVETLPVDPAANTYFDGSVFKACFLRRLKLGDPALFIDPTGNATITPDTEATGTQVILQDGVDGYEFRLGARDRYFSTKLGGYTILGGGVPLMFDGKRVFEMGWWTYPDIGNADLSSASTGGNITDGSYVYNFVWEWFDNLGNVHWSPPKEASITIADGTGTSAITIDRGSVLSQTLREWRIQGDDGRPVVLVIYRTDTNGTLAYRLEGPGVTGFVNNTIGSVDSGLGDYVDTYDATTIALTARQNVYSGDFSAADELANVAPPPTRFLIAHDDRVFGIDDEDPHRVWYSKQAVPGVGPAWNESLYILFQEEVRALASQDGNLIAFTDSKIYTVVGRGYDNTGSSTGYEAPQLLSGERGCPYPRSVVSTPKGTFFLSQRGLEVLPRGGSEPEYIGTMVERTMQTYPIVTDALHVERDSEVWFSVVSAETTSATGRVLAFDYSNRVWFVRNYQGNPISSMVVHDGAVVFGIYDSASSLTLWQEDSGFDDGDGSYVPRTIELGDYRLKNVMGHQEVGFATILGEAFGAELVTVSDSVDSGQTYSDGATFIANAAEPNFQRRYQTRYRKGASHRLKLVFAQNGSTVDTEGIGVIGMTLEGTALRGAARLPMSSQG